MAPNGRNSVSGYLDFQPTLLTAPGESDVTHRWEATGDVKWVVRSPVHFYDSQRDELVALANVNAGLVEKYKLRVGDFLQGEVRGGSLVSILNPPPADRSFWRDLSSNEETFPNRCYEVGGSPALRLVNLLAPLGPGQRGAIIAPAGAGKTTLMRMLAKVFAHKIVTNELDYLFVILVGERPEDVSKFHASLDDTYNVVVWATHFDTPELVQIHSAELSLMAAQRLGEQGKDVVVLVDSLKRLGDSYNRYITSDGKTLPGGIDPGMFRALRFFMGGARAKGLGNVAVIGTLLLEIARTDEATMRFLDGIANWQYVLQGVDARPEGLPTELFPLPDVSLCRTRELGDMFGNEEVGVMGRRALRSQLVETKEVYGTLVPRTRSGAAKQLNRLLSAYGCDDALLAAVLADARRGLRDQIHQEIVNLSGKLRTVPTAAQLILDALLAGPLGWGHEAGLWHLFNALASDEQRLFLARLQKLEALTYPVESVMAERLEPRVEASSGNEAEDLAALGLPRELTGLPV